MKGGDDIRILQRKSVVSMNKISSAKRDAEEFERRRATHASEDKPWIDSKEAKFCVAKNCGSRFTITKRKHHCRKCGGVFCGDCTKYKTVIGGVPKRCCKDCFLAAVEADEALDYLSPGYTNQLTPSSNTQVEQAGLAEEGSESSVSPAYLPHWVEALIFVRRFGDGESNSPSGSSRTPLAWNVKTVYPLDALQAEVVEDILCNALPRRPLLRGYFTQGTAPQNGETSPAQEQKFMVRVRSHSGLKIDPNTAQNDLKSSNSEQLFLNCFVFYKQYALPEGLLCESIVLVSRWPFPELAQQVIVKISEAFIFQRNIDRQEKDVVDDSAGNGQWKLYVDTSTQLSLSIPLNSITPPAEWQISAESASNILMAFYSQILCWPPPSVGKTHLLPLCGDTLRFHVRKSNSNIKPTLQIAELLSFQPLASRVNLISALGPFGLLQHLWVLWELVATRQDIIVVAATPAQCGDMVLAISSLMQPLGAPLDIRPFISFEDSDLLQLAEQSRAKYNKNSVNSSESRGLGSSIIGVTDASILSQLEGAFSAAVFLSPAAMCDTKTVTMSANAAAKLIILSDSHPSLFIAFRNWAVGGFKGSQLVLKQEPTGYKINKLLASVKRLPASDRLLLGDMILRDNLRELSLGFVKAESATVDNFDEKRNDAVKKEATDKARESAVISLPSNYTARNTSDNVIYQLILDLLGDISAAIRGIPSWLPLNISSVMLWTLYVTGLLAGLFFGIPLLYLMTVFLLVPYSPPKQFKKTLEALFPSLIVETSNKEKRRNSDVGPEGGKPATQALSSVSATTTTVVNTGVAMRGSDLSGVWKRVRLENYENLMGAQGAGYVQRKLAASVSMTHYITMDKDLTVFRLMEKGGPVETDNTYQIDGPELATTTLKTDFLDKVSWDQGRLKLRKVRLPDQSYELIIHRELENDGKTLKVSALFRDLKGSASEVQAYSYFQYMGPSPYPTPSPFQARANISEPLAAESTASVAFAGNGQSQSAEIIRPDLSGQWQRIHTNNLEAVLGASGVGLIKRKLAASMALTHSIYMSHGGRPAATFLLHEKGGPLDIRSVLKIDGDFLHGKVGDKPVLQKVFWDSENGAALVFQRRLDSGQEMITTRRLLENNSEMHQKLKEVQPEDLLMEAKVVHRNLLSGNEVVGFSWFKKIGPFSGVPPEVEGKEEDENGHGNDGVELNEEKNAEIGLSVEIDAESESSNEKDDEQFHTSNRESFLPKPILGANVQSDMNTFSLEGSPSKERKPDFSGIWKRDNSAISNVFSSDCPGQDPAPSSPTSPSLSPKIASNQSYTNIITMSGPHLRIQEFGGNVKIEDTWYILSQDIATQDYIDTIYMKKRYRSRCFWENDSLVMHRVNISDNYELRAKRELLRDESGRNLIRLTSTYRNILSGEETESSSIFAQVV